MYFVFTLGNMYDPKEYSSLKFKLSEMGDGKGRVKKFSSLTLKLRIFSNSILGFEISRYIHFLINLRFCTVYGHRLKNKVTQGTGSTADDRSETGIVIRAKSHFQIIRQVK